jgi:hypothetical protein
VTVTYRYPGDQEEITVPSGGLLSGSLVEFASQTWQMQGLQDALEGDRRVIKKGIVVEILKETPANVFAVGATVGYLEATQTATLAGAGDFDITGVARAASGAGVLTVLVALDP